MSSRGSRAVSGGLDSATALAIAGAEGFACYALSVDYGQRHIAELDAARRVAGAAGVIEHRTMRIDLAGIGGSALTDASIAVPEAPTAASRSPTCPRATACCSSLALGWAEVIGACDMFLGVNVLDSSGYPDCRPEFIAAFQSLAAVATKAGTQGAPTPCIPHSSSGPRHRSSRQACAWESTIRADCVLLPGGSQGQRVWTL